MERSAISLVIRNDFLPCPRLRILFSVRCYPSLHSRVCGCSCRSMLTLLRSKNVSFFFAEFQGDKRIRSDPRVPANLAGAVAPLSLDPLGRWRPRARRTSRRSLLR